MQVIAKIGTTIAYFFYELFCQRLTDRKEDAHEVNYNSPPVIVKQVPCD